MAEVIEERIEKRILMNRYKCRSKHFIETISDEVGLDMVLIPKGKFIMGAAKDEIGSRRAEEPEHEVAVESFFMGRYPVTQAQWRIVASLPEIEIKLNPETSYFKGDNRPVEQVSWNDAVEFCSRLSIHTGREYRLPSEAEWEYACRAGTTTPFYFGQTITDKLANYRASETFVGEPKGEYQEQTTEVGVFPANDFGLHDMHGNVWEWCLDDWHEDYNGAPIDGSPWLNDENDNLYQKIGFAVLRGGSWINLPNYCRSAYRNSSVRAERDLILNYIGFRVVCAFGSPLK